MVCARWWMTALWALACWLALSAWRARSSSGARAFYHRVVARWLTRGASSCQCSRVARVSFLVRVLALRVSC